MRIRVVRCPEDAHALPWVLAAECEHWSLACPRARKAKKPHHKLDRGEPGYLVDVTGVDEEGWPYDGPIPDYARETTTKRYAGHWEAERFIEAPRGNLVTCRTGCGLLAAL